MLATLNAFGTASDPGKCEMDMTSCSSARMMILFFIRSVSVLKISSMRPLRHGSGPDIKTGGRDSLKKC